jgi:hypothetical protein
VVSSPLGRKWVCEIESGQESILPTIASYNASVVNFYKATGSLAGFENNFLLLWRCSCKLKSRRIGTRVQGGI